METKYDWIVRDCGLFSALHGLEQPIFLNSRLNEKIYDESWSNRLNGITNGIDSTIISSPPEKVVLETLEWMRYAWGQKRIHGFSSVPSPSPGLGDRIQKNLQLLKDKGYYNPGAIEVEGEWYPPNRLHHLERRIIEEGSC